MTDAPQSIRAHQERGVLEVAWPDGPVRVLPYRFLRGRCPCAACVNEFTGERMVDVSDVPADVRPARMEFSGNYALKVAWSDGHDTGLYTWEYLSGLNPHERPA